MPTTNLRCGNCTKSFETMASYKNEKIECPMCGSEDVEEIKKKRKDKGVVIFELFEKRCTA